MIDRLHESLVSPKDDFGEAGAPGTEIEITPEMIEVGISVLYRFPITEPFESEMREAVAAVYRAMSNIRKPRRESS